MKHILGLILLAIVVLQITQLSSLIHPIMAQEKMQNRLQMAAIKAGIGDPGEKILNAVKVASQQTNLSQELILSVMYSESSFKQEAISTKRYQGLMQIPHSNLLLHKEADVNTLIGARILLTKLALAEGDLRNAIILYKGWKVTDPEGKQQADKVLALMKRLREV